MNDLSLFNHRFRYACLTLLATGFLARAHEQPFPTPCDQLSLASHRERCVHFLADRETVGCQTFSNATTVASYEELKNGMDQDKHGNGHMFLIARDFEIVDLEIPVSVTGTVAIIGDLDRPPIISIVQGDVFDVITAQNNVEMPEALFCWGVEWVLDSPKTIFRVSEHFGTVHITHSIFRTIRTDSITTNSNRYNYLHIKFAESTGWVKNTLLVAHNQFHGVPPDLLDQHVSSDIWVGCPDTRSSNRRITCYDPGKLVIRDNIWHGHSPHSESVSDPNAHVAIQMLNIARAIISGNQAANNHSVVSVNVDFEHTDETLFFDNLNLQLVNNTALPEMNPSQRQFYFDGVAGDGSDYPLAGVVNMTCNPNFNVVTTGSFANIEKYRLTITTENNECSEPVKIHFDNNSECEGTVVRNEEMNEDENNDESGKSGENNCENNCENNEFFVYSTYVLGGSTAALSVVSWELFWSLVYHHTSGKAQTAVNVLALFIPGCFRRALKSHQEKVSAF